MRNTSLCTVLLHFIMSASRILSGQTNFFNVSAKIRVTRDAINVTEVWIEDSAVVDGGRIRKPPSLEGRTKISLSVTELGGRRLEKE